MDKILSVGRKVFVAHLFLFMVYYVTTAETVKADEISELKSMMKDMQTKMDKMQDRINVLETEKSAAPNSPFIDGKLPSLKGVEFSFGGELELEFVKTEKDALTDDEDPRFQIDQLYLYPEAYIGENFMLHGEVAVKSGSTVIEEVWAKFKGLPYNSWILAGMEDQFIAKIDRKSETEILLESVFYRNDEIGIQAGGAPTDWLYWRASITNGTILGTKQPSEDSSYKMLSDAKNTSTGKGRFNALLTGVGLGFKGNLGNAGKFDVMPFYYHGRLDEADVTTLMGITGYGSSTDRDKDRYGMNLRYDLGAFTLIGQFIKSTDGRLDRTGWFIQPSYKKTLDNRKTFNGYELFYRFNDLDVDIDNVFADSRTWDRQQHVIALITDVIKNVKIKTEYIINDEDTGAGDVDNDEFLMQLEVIF